MHAADAPTPSARPDQPGVEPALALLLEAHDCAQTTGQPVWEFATEIACLRAGGTSHAQLRRLIREGYVAHAQERTNQAKGTRTFVPCRNLELPDRACFVLTEAGVAVAGKARQRSGSSPWSLQLHRADGDDARGGPVPRWDGERRCLLWRGHVIKAFRTPAANQTLILAAFEELRWPSRIDDPLPPRPHVDPRRRLHDAIRNLNRHHQQELLLFRGNGDGRGILWEAVR